MKSLMWFPAIRTYKVTMLRFECGGNLVVNCQNNNNDNNLCVDFIIFAKFSLIGLPVLGQKEHVFSNTFTHVRLFDGNLGFPIGKNNSFLEVQQIIIHAKIKSNWLSVLTRRIVYEIYIESYMLNYTQLWRLFCVFPIGKKYNNFVEVCTMINEKNNKN